jgi:hypothetical protein
VANLGRSAMETQAIIRQSFGKESMNHTWVFELHAQFRGGKKNMRQVKSKVKSMLVFFFTSRGFSIKNSSWQAKQ